MDRVLFYGVASTALAAIAVALLVSPAAGIAIFLVLGGLLAASRVLARRPPYGAGAEAALRERVRRLAPPERELLARCHETGEVPLDAPLGHLQTLQDAGLVVLHRGDKGGPPGVEVPADVGRVIERGGR